MSQTEPCASAATPSGPADFIAASNESKRSMCQYTGMATDPTRGLLARIVQPSSPRRSGESSVHLTPGCSAFAANAISAKITKTPRLKRLSSALMRARPRCLTVSAQRPMSGRRQFRLTARTCTRSTRKMPSETPPFWPRYRPRSSAIRTRACRIVWLPRPQIAAGVTTSESDRLVEGANLRISVTRGCRSQRSGPEGRGASRKGARL
jgi:hypothetical protein